MAATPPNKVPVLKIIAGSILIAWTNKARYSAGIALPTLLIVGIWAVHWTFWPDLEGVAAWAVWATYVAAFAIFAVTCHRLVLLDGADMAFRISVTMRELKFLGWIVMAYAIYYPLVLVPMTIFVNLPFMSARFHSADDFYYTQLAFSVPAMYVLARLCLVLPATAIDMNRGLRWSWARTRGNGWRIAIIIGLYPWLIGSALWLLSRDKPTTVEWTLTALLYYVGLAVQVFALSLTYREVTAFGDPAASS